MVVFPYFTSCTTPFSSIKTSTGKPVNAPLRLVNGLNPLMNIAFINLKKPTIEPSNTPSPLFSMLYLSK